MRAVPTVRTQPAKTSMTRPAPPLPRRSHALFLDFDGTLAPIQDDPDAVILPPGGADLLTALAARLDGALAVISGRDVRDLAGRVPSGVWRAGGHGLVVCAPGEDAPASAPDAPAPLAAAILALLAERPGTRLERKGPVLAVHYRAAPEAGEALRDALAGLISDHEGYRLQSGKMVHELKPEGADKGATLARMLERAPFAGRAPVMVGDDTTDEDAMRAAQGAGGFAVKVGTGTSLARYGLSGPEAVWAWLERALR